MQALSTLAYIVTDLQVTASPWHHVQFSPATVPMQLQHRQPHGRHQATHATAPPDSGPPTTLSPETLQLLNELALKQAAFLQQQAIQTDHLEEDTISSQDSEAIVNPLSILKEIAARQWMSSEDVVGYFRRLAACRPAMPQAHFRHSGYLDLVVMLSSSLQSLNKRQASSIMQSLAALGADRMPDESVVAALLSMSTAEVALGPADENLLILQALVSLKHTALVMTCLSMLMMCKVMHTPSVIADMLEMATPVGRGPLNDSLLRQADICIVEATDLRLPEHAEVRTDHSM